MAHAVTTSKQLLTRLFRLLALVTTKPIAEVLGWGRLVPLGVGTGLTTAITTSARRAVVTHLGAVAGR